MSESAAKVVRLRPVLPDDYSDYFHIQADPVGCEQAGVYARSSEAFETFWATLLQNPELMLYTILADEQLVGYITCFQAGGEDTIGYAIARDHWGQGYASQALALFLQNVPKRPLHATTFKSNLASRRVLEKNNFVLVGYHSSEGTERYMPGEEAVYILN